MQEFSIWYAIAVFFFYVLIEALYVIYTLSIIKRKAFRSAFYSGITAVVVAVGVVSYTANHLYIISAGLGSFVGTFLAVRLNRILKNES